MQQFEIEKDQDNNLWDNIRQYRKNFKPNKSPNCNSNNASTDQKHTQNQIVGINSQYNDSNKENMWTSMNAGTEQPFKKKGEEEEQGFTPISKGTQPFHNPLSQEYEVNELRGFIFDSAKAVYSSRLVKSTQKEMNSSFMEKGDLENDDSFEETDFAQSIQGDQMIIHRLVEVKS